MPQTNRFQDHYGLTLTANSVTAVEHYLKGIDQFLSVDVGAEGSLAQAIEADEGFAAAYASLVLIQQFQGTAAEAKQSAARARTCMAGLSKRERQYVEAIAMFVDGRSITTPAARSTSLGTRLVLARTRTNRQWSAGERPDQPPGRATALGRRRP